MVVIISQCQRGSVDWSTYETGAVMHGEGVIDGKDMTLEAAVTKLAVLMGRGYRGDRLRTLMESNVRGELTVKKTQSYGSIGEMDVVPTPSVSSQSSSELSGQTTTLSNTSLPSSL